MPSQYDHTQQQGGKARKRSNLPKQSTEIMKVWFDQATGISMTQVSNWFINHRRRCPELRDRRDKHRGVSRDVEMV
ncbi:hypothetical protein LTR62_006502 [Meristemomyces frigidus]|uniref:KN homeodomain domain-containing protein n=1 Tax=Meristemomyces frigidus TaxID=1508187 RepID=A0AAN7TNC7_9PEZI|nr:hypothetical protein LTR62_006502 [Meristemomyces frigidus]